MKIIAAVIAVILCAFASVKYVDYKDQRKQQRQAIAYLDECSYQIMRASQVENSIESESTAEVLASWPASVADQYAIASNTFVQQVIPMCEYLLRFKVEDIKFNSYVKSVDWVRLHKNSTAQDPAEYAWRIDTLNTMLERLDETAKKPAVLYEDLRKMVAQSTLPEALRINVFSRIKRMQVLKNSEHKIYLESMVVLVQSVKDLVEFLYENKDNFEYSKYTRKFVFRSKTIYEDFNKITVRVRDAIEQSDYNYKVYKAKRN